MKEKIISVIIVVLLFIAGLTFYLKKTPLYISSPLSTIKEVVTNKDNAGTVSGSIVSSKKSATLGEYLTDSKSATLYVFTDDARLQSNCNGDCLKKWPAFAYDNKNVASSTDMLSKRMNVIKRSDGTYQYAYGTQPLYYYAGDKVAGDTNGLGTNKWTLVLITN